MDNSRSKSISSKASGSQLDYRWMLRDVLLSRLKKNPQYSSRAFARDIGLSSGFLSQVLGGGRNLSERSSLRISRELNWTEKNQELFISLVRYEAADDVDLKLKLLENIEQLDDKTSSFRFMDREKFELVAKWYYFSIVELAKIKSIDLTPKYASKVFGITVQDAKLAIDKLIALDLISKDESGYSATEDCYGVLSVTSDGIKEFHRHHLQLAQKALAEQTVKQRNFSGVTMAIDPKNLGKASELIKKFRRDMMGLLEEGEAKSVYHLAVQLYQLDRDK